MIKCLRDKELFHNGTHTHTHTHTMCSGVQQRGGAHRDSPFPVSLANFLSSCWFTVPLLYLWSCVCVCVWEREVLFLSVFLVFQFCVQVCISVCISSKACITGTGPHRRTTHVHTDTHTHTHILSLMASQWHRDSDNMVSAPGHPSPESLQLCLKPLTHSITHFSL